MLPWSHAPKHTLSTVHMPAPMHYINQLTACGRSTKLHGLYREADWNEDQQTRGGVTRP